MNFNNTPFAEIEIDTTQSRSSFEKEALRLNSSAIGAQPIEPREVDPIRMKFYEMRKLASSRPFARSDSELFYKQAKFMETFTDEYSGNAKFNMYFPYYQNMGYDYLRTYFTWRTKVRMGEYLPTSLSYIFLYIYELLSGVGVSDPIDGLNKLLTIWYTFAKGNLTIERYLAKWFKDYHVFYELPHSFFNFVTEHNLQKYYHLSFLFDENVENKLEMWNSISGYDITKSKFYNDGNEELFSDCFSEVLKGIQHFCMERDTRFEDMLVYSVSRRTVWKPFENALFQSNYKQSDRELIFSDFEKYFCKNGEWTAIRPIFYSSQKDFVGYIIKKTEACLRKATNYKYKLVADLKSGTKPFRELKKVATRRTELDKTIEQAVEKFHFNLNRTIVTVDVDNLKRIRSEALETQEQLIVPEDMPSSHHCAMNPSPESFVMAGSEATWPPGSLKVHSMPPETPITLSAEQTQITMNFSDGWSALRDSLTEVEQRALSVALDGGDVKSFADENGLMLEILIDGINEKAADYIGDSIIELGEDVYIYDEYREHIGSW